MFVAHSFQFAWWSRIPVQFNNDKLRSVLSESFKSLLGLAEHGSLFSSLIVRHLVGNLLTSERARVSRR